MLIETHCHTREHSSCSAVAAADLAMRCFEEGLQGLVLTDHHHLWPAAELAELRRRLAVPDFFLLAAGQEVTTGDFGDILVYGPRETIPRGARLEDIRRRYPEAALVWAHPYRNGARPAPERLLNPRLNGVEIFNSNHTFGENHRGLMDWHRFKFTALGGTDTHAESYAATYPTAFDHPVRTVAEIAAEIRHGRCRPFLREIPHAGTSDTEVTEIGLGTDAQGRSRETIIVKDHGDPGAWTAAERTARIVDEIARCGFEGGTFRVPRPLGRDPESFTSIEEGIRGSSLFDRVAAGSREEASHCLRLAAQWLARLHNCRLQVTPAGAWLENEPVRLAHYLSALEGMNHPHTRKAREIMIFVLETERALYAAHPERLVQGHGDFHPKNILIGEDGDGPLFVAAIDFDSSFTMPPAFDVGTFLAQFRNQFFAMREVHAKVTPDLFTNAYLHDAATTEGFLREVQLFKARTSLSIAYYLVKVGLGESENLWRVLVEAEESLTRVAATAS
ncbi:MAG: phosphotransferase [Desulfobacteraceae bacterium]|nr:phosphotransferase [Desulfobacteraceae bacterium]